MLKCPPKAISLIVLCGTLGDGGIFRMWEVFRSLRHVFEVDCEYYLFLVFPFPSFLLEGEWFFAPLCTLYHNMLHYN